MTKKKNYHVIGACSGHLIGACSGWGAQLRACEKGPEELLQGLAIERQKNREFPLTGIEMLYPEKRAADENIPLPESLPFIKKFNLKLFHAVRKAIKRDQFPIVIGGDHSIAVGTWNAFVDVPFGLLWIDAHMDAHTVESSPSGAYHGMPVAELLGYGTAGLGQLIDSQVILKPCNVALVGVRSFEVEEYAFLKQRGVKIYFMDEVRKRGLQQIIPEAIAHITQGVEHYGVSLDLDAFSPEEAPGVGSPEPLGIKKSELLPLISIFGKDKRLIGFEMVEFNPERDVDHKTRELMIAILKELIQ